MPQVADKLRLFVFKYIYWFAVEVLGTTEGDKVGQ
jgi:hypothetical protein